MGVDVTNSKHIAGLIGPTLMAFDLSEINSRGQDYHIYIN